MGERDDDERLDALDHDELVAHLNRLYAEAGERSLSPSAAKASTDAELRERIETLRVRRGQRKAGAVPLPPTSTVGRRVLDRRGTGNAADEPERVLCVLLTANEATASAARALMRARGIPLVLTTTSEGLRRVLASVTPSHVVLDGALDESAVRHQLGVRAADVRVFWCDGEEAAIAALAIVS